MKLLSTIFCLFLFSTTNAQMSTEFLTVEGQNRSYIQYLPSDFNPDNSIPLVLSFHGGAGSASDQLELADLRNLSDAEGFVLVYPNAFPDSNNNQETNWQVVTSGDLPFTMPNPHDDILFIEQLINHLQNDLNIDSNRVYAMGYSNGGGFTFDLACRLNEKITGIGVVARTMYIESLNACSVSHPTPVITILGTEDYISPYNGAIYEGTLYYESAETVNDYWIEVNNLLQDYELTLIPNTNTVDDSTVELYRWESEDQCIEMFHYKVLGGDHDWPGTIGNMDIISHNLIWDHLSNYGMNGKLECESASLSYNGINNSFNRKIEKVIDALGREVNPTTNQILFHIYDDGTVEKRFVLE